jgi:hypothetical protein
MYLSQTFILFHPINNCKDTDFFFIYQIFSHFFSKKIEKNLTCRMNKGFCDIKKILLR